MASIMQSLFGGTPTMKLTWNDQDSLPSVRVPADDDRQMLSFEREMLIGMNLK